MSNIKKINVVGVLPFCIDANPAACMFLGQLNRPNFGLSIEYGDSIAPRPNAHGGQTTYYGFNVIGEEAVSVGWLQALLGAFVDAGAEIREVLCTDIENDERIRVRIPEKRNVSKIALILTIPPANDELCLDLDREKPKMVPELARMLETDVLDLKIY